MIASGIRTARSHEIEATGGPGEKAADQAYLGTGLERYRRLVENLERAFFIYTHGRNGVFTYLSESVRDILGYEPSEFMGHDSTYLTASEMNEGVQERTDLSIRGVKQPPYEFETFRAALVKALRP